jgi:hypothetical protein
MVGGEGEEGASMDGSWLLQSPQFFPSTGANLLFIWDDKS